MRHHGGNTFYAGKFNMTFLVIMGENNALLKIRNTYAKIAQFFSNFFYQNVFANINKIRAISFSIV